MLSPYTSTDLQRNPKAVYDAVEKEPVEIRRGGHSDMVLMLRTHYIKLLNSSKTKQSEANLADTKNKNKNKTNNDNDNKSDKDLLDFSVLLLTDLEIEEVKAIRNKNKGGKFTARIIKGLALEFEQARKNGITNDQILTEWDSRNWKSFKAEWMQNYKQSTQMQYFETQKYQSGKM